MPIEVIQTNLLINYFTTLFPKLYARIEATDHFYIPIFNVKTKIVPKLSRKFKANDTSLIYIQKNLMTRVLSSYPSSHASLNLIVPLHPLYEICLSFQHLPKVLEKQNTFLAKYLPSKKNE